MTKEELHSLNKGNYIVYIAPHIKNWGYVHGRDNDNLIIISWSHDASGFFGGKTSSRCYHAEDSFMKMGLDSYLFIRDEKEKLAIQIKYSDKE